MGTIQSKASEMIWLFMKLIYRYPIFGVVILEIFKIVFVMNDLHFNFPNNKLKEL